MLRRAAEAADSGTGRSYLNITGFPFPLGPLFARRTVRTQVGDGIWTFEQEQSLVNIAVNVRMTVIRLSTGELWVHNPVAPTDECIELLKELGLPVRYIVLGTVQYEHKIFVGPFSRRWPDAQVFITPEQYAFPFDLPPQLLGIFPTREIQENAAPMPWADEIEQCLLKPENRLVGGYSAVECAFFHKRSKTLLCTDALVYVPQEPPAVLDLQELRRLGTDNNLILDLIKAVDWRGSGDLIRRAQEEKRHFSDEELLKIGWQRDALLSLFFGPDGASLLDPEEAFNAVSGRWIVGPVCYSLVYRDSFREDVRAWADRVCQWDFQQILPSHFAGPVAGTSSDVRRAFEVLDLSEDATEASAGSTLPWPFPQPVRYRAKDLQLLTDIRNVLKQVGLL